MHQMKITRKKALTKQSPMEPTESGVYYTMRWKMTGWGLKDSFYNQKSEKLLYESYLNPQYLFHNHIEIWRLRFTSALYGHPRILCYDLIHIIPLCQSSSTAMFVQCIHSTRVCQHFNYFSYKVGMYSIQNGGLDRAVSYNAIGIF